MTYFRFGKIPANEKSLNWFRLSFREQEDVGYSLKCGDSLAYALRKAGVDESRKDLFEDGVSVFKADENGLPIIENLQQLVSLAGRIGEIAYTMTGEEVGKGTDAEPVIRNVSNVKESTMTAAELEEIVVKTLEANYTRIEELDYISDDVYVVDGGYKDFAGNDVEHSVSFKGREYFGPVDGWNTATGYYAYR